MKVFKIKNEDFLITSEMEKYYFSLPRTKNNKIAFNWKNKITNPELIVYLLSIFKNFENLKFIFEKNKTEFPKCLNCGKELDKFNIKFCSKTCSSNNELVKIKSKNTCLEKYGTEFSFNSKNNIEKTKKTNIKKYGFINSIQSKEIQDKIKQTNLEKYGVENVFASEQVKDKIKKTNLERYGVENPNKNINTRNKIQQTCLEKYGFECPSKNINIKNKIKITQRINYWDKLNLLLKNKNIIPLFSKEEYINWNNEELKYKCLDCNKDFLSFFAHYQSVYCPYCYKELRSGAEKELAIWLKDLGLNVIESSRDIIKPLEIDIYLPDYNLAIEYNGLYWHSLKDKNYHLNKTKLCRDKNIQLLHIFENEWINKSDIVKSIILAKLGIFEQRIYARKCELREIDSNIYKSFCEDNHIQGYAIASKRLGLFYQDELVSIASWSKSRFKKNEYELIRFCTKLNTQVIGGLSKLIKASNLGEFITYCDLRYSDGSGYENNNFELIGQSSPNYFYFKGLNLESRIKYQKHKLNALLENFDSNLSEQENMINNGYLRIFDCGNLKFKWNS